LQTADTAFDLGVFGVVPLQPTDGWIWGIVRDGELSGTATPLTVDRRSSSRQNKPPSKMIESIPKVLEEIANHECKDKGWLTRAQVEDIARGIRIDLGAYEVRAVVSVPRDLLIDELQVMIGPPDLSINTRRERNHQPARYATIDGVAS
jgi:hypothetical protein